MFVGWVKNVCCSVPKSCPTLCDPMDCSMPDSSVLHYLPEFAQIHVDWVSDAIQTISSSVHSLLLLPSIVPSIRIFSSESVLHIRWPKYWSFRFRISASNEYSALISFRMDWLDSLQFTGLSKVFSSTTFQKHQFFSAQVSLWSNSHIHIWLMEEP